MAKQKTGVPKVLLVEDSPKLSESLVSYMKKWANCEITVCDDFTKANGLIQSKTFDVVMSDLFHDKWPHIVFLEPFLRSAAKKSTVIAYTAAPADYKNIAKAALKGSGVHFVSLNDLLVHSLNEINKVARKLGQRKKKIGKPSTEMPVGLKSAIESHAAEHIIPPSQKVGRLEWELLSLHKKIQQAHAAGNVPKKELNALIDNYQKARLALETRRNNTPIYEHFPQRDLRVKRRPTGFLKMKKPLI
ncbi:MAG: response regulator [Candidatus Diapherotrites archaeon]